MSDKVVRVFLDFEFTGLRQNTTPISVGLCTDMGPETLYCEFSDYDRSQVDGWVAHNIVNRLKFPYTGWQEGAIHELDFRFKGVGYAVAKVMEDWFYKLYERYDHATIHIWGDVLAYDWVLFCALMATPRGLPEIIYYIPFDISTLMLLRGVDPDIDRFKYAGLPEEEKHTALADAICIKECYEKLMQPDYAIRP